MRRQQAGVSLSGLLMSAVVLAVLALFGMKVVPDVIEYLQIRKAVKSISNDPNSKNSVAEVRKAFDRASTVDNISSIGSQDLDVTKEGSDVVVSFAYEKRIPLFTNVSLLINFEGSSKE
jgi:hypothetical protein